MAISIFTWKIGMTNSDEAQLSIHCNFVSVFLPKYLKLPYYKKLTRVLIDAAKINVWLD